MAASAHKAGLPCKVIDLFNDLDTQAYSVACATASLTGYQWQIDNLLAAVERLDPQHRCDLMYGSGFEVKPSILYQLSRHRRLLGNTSQCIAGVKDPWQLAETLQKIGIPHPEITHTPSADKHWLGKRQGACGGSHIRRDSRNNADYWQQYVQGRNLSVTILSDNTSAYIVGYCEQWCLENEEQPYTYEGAVTLSSEELTEWLRANIRDAAQTLTEEMGLCGLWCIDFIASEDQWWLLEINPRPGMTFELHEQDREESFIHWHIATFNDQLPNIKYRFNQHRGHAVVYADEHAVIANVNWPAWAKDRPQSGTSIEQGQPVCTVYAAGESAVAVRAKLHERSREIKNFIKN